MRRRGYSLAAHKSMPTPPDPGVFRRDDRKYGRVLLGFYGYRAGKTAESRKYGMIRSEIETGELQALSAESIYPDAGMDMT